ncbi:MAG: Na+/H+ antiporter subunit E [Alphaproteobacteria bacterium]|nr:Na+/H+ antiporter subunit E [Alphaproteobacteria bacterium]
MPNTSSQQKATGEESRQQTQSGARVDRLGHAVSLAVALFVTWLLLSGHYTPFILSLGVISCVVIVFIAARMDVIDDEALPIHLTFKIFGYWGWLLKEIWIAAVDVTKRVLSPKLRISPTIVQLKTTQRSELGKVIYANSITLTPGTFTIRVFGDQILVHALSKEGADGLAEGEMDRRVTELEGPQ